MFRVLHLTSRIGFNFVKGIAGLESEDPHEILQQAGGCYSKIAQMSQIRGDNDAVFNDCIPFNSEQLAERFTAFLVEHGLASYNTGRSLVHSGSIGGVYLVSLGDGREVAVKIKYPGIDAVVNDDLSLLRMGAAFSSGVRSESSTQCIESILCELDYRAEQTWIDTFHAMWGDEYRIPATLPELCSADVTCMTCVQGESLLEVRRNGSEERKIHLASQLIRFLLVTWARDNCIYTDPHWGNFCVCENDVLGIVDFGGVVRVPPSSFQYISTKILAAQADPSSLEMYRELSSMFLQPFHSSDDVCDNVSKALVASQSIDTSLPPGSVASMKMLFLAAGVIQTFSIPIDLSAIFYESIHLFNESNDDHHVCIDTTHR